MTLMERVRRCMKEAVDRHECAGLTLLVRRDGREVLYAEEGWADIEAKRPVRRDSLFRLYSQSKPVTAAAVMLLMERGQIDLMDPAEKFLPGFRGQQVWTPDGLVPAQRPVLLLDLLGMTAGLCYPGDDGAGQYASRLFQEAQEKILAGGGIGTVELANRIGSLPLAFQPGTDFRYSTCADVLGAVVEVVAGKPFAQFLADEFFTTLGMKDTAFFVPGDKQDRFVTCYERMPGGIRPFRSLHLAVGDYTREPAFASGGAGLVSTLDDYAAFADMLMNRGEYQGKRILSPATVDYMTRPQHDLMHWDGLTGHRYGKLMRVCVDPGASPILAWEGEYGWDGWLGTYFANLPALKTTILLMQNTTNAGTSTVTRKLRNIVLAELGAR